MAKATEPLFSGEGRDWKFWEKFAHEYGKGPIGVFVKDPRTASYLAEAVRRWNEATGIAVFGLVFDPEEADISIKLTDLPPGEGGWAAPDLDDREGGSESTVFLSRARAREKDTEGPTTRPERTIAHELGHTVGLGHPLTARLLKRGVDKRYLMAGGVDISPEEARRARKVVAPTAKEREKRRRQLLAQDPTPGSAPGR